MRPARSSSRGARWGRRGRPPPSRPCPSGSSSAHARRRGRSAERGGQGPPAEPTVPVEIVFGQRETSAVIAEAVRQVPPPPPPAAPMPAPSLIETLAGALRGGRASWLPSLLPTAATLVLTVIVLRHG